MGALGRIFHFPFSIFHFERLPLGIDLLIGELFVGAGGVEGTARLRHQLVELAALVVLEYLLPFGGTVVMGVLQHLEQKVGLVHGCFGVLRCSRNDSSARRRCL